MRVAIVCDWYLPRFGGIENHLRDLTVDLVRAGIDVEVLTPMPGPSTVDGVKVTRLCDETLPDGGYTFPPPPQATSLRDLGFYIDMFFGRRKPTAYQRLRDALTADRFDLAHVHFGNSPFAFAAARHAVEQHGQEHQDVDRQQGHGHRCLGRPGMQQAGQYRWCGVSVVGVAGWAVQGGGGRDACAMPD